MSSEGLFSTSLVASEWFDDKVEGWFDDSLVTNGITGITLTPALDVNVNEFYEPTLVRGAVTLTPALDVNVNEFYEPTVRAVSRLRPQLDVNINEFYEPTIIRGTVTLTVALDVNLNEFYEPVVKRVVLARRTDFDNTNEAVRSNTNVANRPPNVSGAKRNIGVSFRQPNVVRTRR